MKQFFSLSGLCLTVSSSYMTHILVTRTCNILIYGKATPRTDFVPQGKHVHSNPHDNLYPILVFHPSLERAHTAALLSLEP